MKPILRFFVCSRLFGKLVLFIRAFCSLLVREYEFCRSMSEGVDGPPMLILTVFSRISSTLYSSSTLTLLCKLKREKEMEKVNNDPPPPHPLTQ